ncbi:MAG: ATP synthase F1 subunit gamma [Puniceicoccales bacterium]|jgi:F-type H+-transporting ATPase subunit gamma|nr:ATP synthase F1 subunit gamma [Puniceicoccales bacterium]
MKGVKEIRSRIKAVNNTAKITRAMQLVASSKMKKAQQLALLGRPYMLLLTEIAENLSKLGPSKLRHPFFERREVKTRGIVAIGTDRGLCGALNQNILKFINANIARNENVKFITIGKKAMQLISLAKWTIVANFNVSDRTDYCELVPIVEFLKNAYLANEIDSLEVIFAQYINPLIQEPINQHILPMLDFHSELERLCKNMHINSGEITYDQRPMLVEPNVGSVVAMLSQMFLSQNIYRVILEAKASEHSSRTMAMRGATDNAETLSKELSLEHNKLRQAAITNEIIEISAAIQGL